jgi:hypothetical protein
VDFQKVEDEVKYTNHFDDGVGSSGESRMLFCRDFGQKVHRMILL